MATCLFMSTILLIVLKGIECIVLTPPVWIQGQPASITCNDYNIVFISRDVLVTSCPVDPYVNCSISPNQPNKPVYNYTNYFTVSKSGNDVSVNIANVSKDRDEGYWICSGSTNTSAQNITIDVKVIKPVPSVNIQVPNLIVNQTTDIICKTGVSYPHATFTWSINGGNNLGSGTTSNNSDGTTTSILQYTADKSDDNKILQCTATNGYGPNKTDSIKLNITYPPILHIEPTGDYSIIQGKQLMLTCNVDDANPSVPGNGYTWSKDGVQITGKTSSTYTLPSHRSDTGSYTCTGSNNIGRGATSTPVQVDVLYPPIVSTPSTYQVIESTNLTLQCTATANPANIKYRWTGPGGLTSTGPSLTISNIGKDKSGVYTCTATNSMMPSTGPQETGRGTNTTTVAVLYGPTVTISPDNITKILENTDHRLNCTVQSDPTPAMFTWYLPNRTSIPGKRELVISKRDQGGIYRCEASTTLVPTDGRSINRSDSTTINITVLYLDQVSIIPDDIKLELNKGDSTNITCSTNSNPVALITWYNGTTRISSKQTNINTFTILQATCLDTGDYTCQATNAEISNVQHNQSLKLSVNCPPRQDTRVITTSIVSGNISDIVQLVANVISYPPPTFTWYYNNITTGDVEPIYNDDVFKQIDTSISINTYTSTLYINIASNIYYTSYTVNVSNNIGNTQLQYQVTDQSKPDVPSNISYSSTDDGICITWTPGVNGGDQQEFIVQHSVDNKTWTSSTPLQESDYCIKNLLADTPYYIRVIAKTKYGDSQPVYLISSDGSSTVQTLPRETTDPNWVLIGGIVGGVVAAILVILFVVVMVKKQRQSVYKKEDDNEYGSTVALDDVSRTRHSGMVIDEVVNYVSGDEIRNGETVLYAQVKKENKTTETKPNPESLYAKVNKNNNDENTQSRKPDVKSKKPEIKPKKPDINPKKPDTKPTIQIAKVKQQAAIGKSVTPRGEAYENVGIFGDINGMSTNEYENHSIKHESPEPVTKEVVYADLDFDGHKPTTAVRGQDDAVEYSGIDYTKRGPTQPTPPASSDEDDDRE